MKKLSPVAVWLFSCAAAIFLTTLVGAVTRLTESGLSIVEWKPVAGVLPPLTGADWAREFSLYQQSPQYRLVNHGMSLGEYKRIFFWEWLHRFIDRLIGVLYLLPYLYFLAKGMIPAGRRKPLFGLFLLGGAQGALGFIMVKSGLAQRPAVSHYLLAAHLMLATLIYACMLRAGFLFTERRAAGAERLSGLRGLFVVAVCLVVTTMTWGAFTAGLRAGLLYGDTFPLMGAHLWPAELFSSRVSVFEEGAAVQFGHRVLAVLSFCTLLLASLRGLRLSPPPVLRKVLHALGGMAFVQVALGVATLMSHVNIALATAHQAGALVILGLLMVLLHTVPKGGAHEPA